MYIYKTLFSARKIHFVKNHNLTRILFNYFVHNSEKLLVTQTFKVIIINYMNWSHDDFCNQTYILKRN